MTVRMSVKGQREMPVENDSEDAIRKDSKMPLENDSEDAIRKDSEMPLEKTVQMSVEMSVRGQ